MGCVCKSRRWPIKLLSHANPSPPTKLYVNQHRIFESLKFALLDISSFFRLLCREQSSQKKKRSKKYCLVCRGEVLIDFVLKPVFDTANEFATGMETWLRWCILKEPPTAKAFSRHLIRMRGTSWGCAVKVFLNVSRTTINQQGWMANEPWAQASLVQSKAISRVSHNEKEKR